MGAEAYRAEQEWKIRILAQLLENYNDGRKKNFLCLAVNLLEAEELKTVVRQMDEELGGLPIKEKAACMKKRLEDIAAQRQVVLKLRKKK